MVIEYCKYQEGNRVSFDNDLLEELLTQINEIFMRENIVCFSDTMDYLDVLLFEGNYMPFLSRMSIDHVTYGPFPIHENLEKTMKHGKNKIFVNNVDKTKLIKQIHEKFIKLCNEIQDLGSIYAHWKGNKII